MLRVFVLFLLYTTPLISLSQELNSKVIINTDKLQSSEKLLFEEMQTNIEQFLNSQIWTNDKFNSQEKINCNFIINIINQPSSNQYEATVQIVSSRPIYNSSYETILLNHGDREWIFEYFPSQTIEFVENGFNDNLTSLLSFYAYLIIGIDYDSFQEKGGEENFKAAWKILNQSQNSGYKGWDQFGSRKNRYWICENFLNPEFEKVRKAIYNYHIKGMDNFYSNPEESRSTILNEETMEVGYKVDYQHQVKIHQLRRPLDSSILNVNTRNIIYTVELKDAFPTTIQSLDLSNDLDSISSIIDNNSLHV